MLYGGLTEEILLRWGLMVLVAWTAWRVLQRGRGRPAGTWLVLAAIVSAAVFSIAHVPAAAGMGVVITAPVMLYVTAVNFIPGLLFGLLFWRRGLEAACIAHMVAHLGIEIAYGSGP
jgi:membrane protease YdiL (CAAX protease family)